MLDTFREMMERVKVDIAIAAERVRLALREARGDAPPMRPGVLGEMENGPYENLVMFTHDEFTVELPNPPPTPQTEPEPEEITDVADLDMAMLDSSKWESVHPKREPWEEAARAWRNFECDRIQADIYRAQEQQGCVERHSAVAVCDPITTDGKMPDQKWQK